MTFTLYYKNKLKFTKKICFILISLQNGVFFVNNI